MFRILLGSAFSLIFLVANTQVVVVLDSVPEDTPAGAAIFLTGNFQGWNPGDSAFLFEVNDAGSYVLVLHELEEGDTLKYKCTLGSWERVEQDQHGADIANREYRVRSRDTLHITIESWSKNNKKRHTAQPNVEIFSDSLLMSPLERTRKVWVYLPPDYDGTTGRYPVVYMHDGQNLFDAGTAFSGEWEVDETLNRLHALGYRVPIVVGIENGGPSRIEEYTPWVHPEYGGGSGEAYLQFLVETLKPAIDDAYRTLRGRKYTALAGSSLGGLISLFGVLTRPDVYGKCAALSPAYWIVFDSLGSMLDTIAVEEPLRIFQSFGTLEGTSYIADMNFVDAQLGNRGVEQRTTTSILGGEHSEKSWVDAFAKAYLWLFASWANEYEESEALEPIWVTYSPENDSLFFSKTILNKGDVVTLVNKEAGIEQRIEVKKSGTAVQLPTLPAGVYVIRIERDGILYLGRFDTRC